MYAGYCDPKLARLTILALVAGHAVSLQLAEVPESYCRTDADDDKDLDGDAKKEFLLCLVVLFHAGLFQGDDANQVSAAGCLVMPGGAYDDVTGFQITP